MTNPITYNQPSLLNRFYGQKHVASNPQFSGVVSAIGANALSQFQTAMVGVGAPKALLSFKRSAPNGFEDLALESIEAGAFYFTLPIISRFILAPAVAALSGLKGGEKEWLGKSLKNLAKPHSNKLIASKFGVIMGALSVACGLEYCIQFLTNVITAKLFGTTDFNAVAGLEKNHKSNSKLDEDPVLKKAYKRFKQIGAVTAGLLGFALLAPLAIAHSNVLSKLTKPLVQVLDFASRGTFDLTKTTSAILIGTGVISYVDASRSDLEVKEVQTRLSMVVPYLLFGKELISNSLAKIVEKLSLPGSRQSVKNHRISFIDRSERFRDSWLNLNQVKTEAVLQEELKTSGLSSTVQEAIQQRYKWIGRGATALCALFMGLGFTWLTYHLTNQRYHEQKKANQKTEPNSSTVSAITEKLAAKNPFKASLQEAIPAFSHQVPVWAQYPYPQAKTYRNAAWSHSA